MLLLLDDARRRQLGVCSVEVLSDVLVYILTLGGDVIFGRSKAKGLEAALDTCRFRLLVFCLLGRLTSFLGGLELFCTLLIALSDQILFLLLELLPL